VPASRAEVAEYLQQMRPKLLCTPTTRNGARLLLAPPMPMRAQDFSPARPGWPALAALGFRLMPRWARRIYHLPGSPPPTSVPPWPCEHCAQSPYRCPNTTGSVLSRSKPANEHRPDNADQFWVMTSDLCRRPRTTAQP